MRKKSDCLAVRLFTALFLTLLCSSLFAQKTVTGKITDKANSQPISGVSVLVKGTTTGTQTDAEGLFSIKVPSDNSTLAVSVVGYTSTEMSVNGRTSVDFVLEASSSTLNEIVVTGYTSQKKKDLTGAVSVVDLGDATKQPVATVTSQLQGQASGVTILGSGQPGQEPRINIRGFNTFGNNTPLFVVDGVQTQNINDLNPSDISSLQILKDAGAASIYGSRANNGVVVITTKKGQGKVKVQYDMYLGTQEPKKGNVWNLLNSQEAADLKFLALRNSGIAPTDSTPDALYGGGTNPRLPDYIIPGGAMEGDPSVDPSLYNLDPNYTNSDDVNHFYRIARANKTGTDYFHEVFNSAPIASHNISVSGGGTQGNFFTSFSYFNQQGTLINTYNKRYTVRANSNFNVSQHIRVGENLEVSNISNPQIGILQEGSAIGMSFRQQVIIPVYDINGNFASTFSTNGVQLGNAKNPVAIQYRSRNNRANANRIFGSGYVEADFLKYFTARSVFGGEAYNGNSHSFNYPEYENSENIATNQYNESAYYGYNWNWTNTVAFHKLFASKHDVRVLLGYESTLNRDAGSGGSTQGYFSFDPNYVTLSNGSGAKSNYSYRSSSALVSQFARLDYTFNEKYLLSATVRRDGATQFRELGGDFNYGVFPSVSLGWRISQEEFMKSVTWLTDLKIRGSYGAMGNQFNIPGDNFFNLYNSDKGASYYAITGSNSVIAEGFRQSRIGAETKWETDYNSNIGFDASLFKGAVELTVDYYQKDIRDLIYTPDVPATAGAAQPPAINIGNIKSNGFDASVRGVVNITKDLKFDYNATLTTYNTEIKKVSDRDYFDAEARRFSNAIIRNAVGHGLSQFYGYQIDGFWNSQQEINDANAAARKATGDSSKIYQADAGVGRFRYKDVTSQGYIDANSRTFIGNPNPKFTYGLNLGLTYKGFDFSIFFYGSQGNDIWNNVRWWTDFYPSFAGAKSKTALYDSWTPDHQNAKVAIQENTGNFSTNGVPNSYFIEDGSYLRAKNVLLGYTLPESLLKKAGISRLRVYVQAANLFTITNYSGLDPEVTGGTANFGLDEGNYPNSRQYLFGVNVSF